MGPTEVIKEVSLGRGGERRVKRRRPDGRIGEGGFLREVQCRKHNQIALKIVMEKEKTIQDKGIKP